MIDQIKPLLGKLCSFSQKKMGFSHPPRLFLRSDNNNSQKVLGKTAFYDPDNESVTLFITGRHPKDILRSFAHELVHHSQNLRGDLSADKVGSMSKNYAQENDHMRNMEKEAYLKGNMCFRDWEDTIEDKDKFLIKLAESKFLKENKTMTTKITKEFLRDKIRDILSEKIGGKELAQALLNNDQEILKKYDDDSKMAKQSQKKIKGAKAGRELAKQVYSGDIKDLEEGEGELEVGPGLPDTVKPDLEIKPTLKQLIKQKQDEMMSSMEEAIAELKAELEAMEMQANNPEPEIKEGAGCAKRGCVDRKCPTHGPAIREAEELEEGDGNAKTSKHDDNPKLKGGQKNLPDALQKGIIGSSDSEDDDADDSEKEKKEESKIRTPEQENTIYEQRFTPKNNRLFEKLVKEWTK